MLKKWSEDNRSDDGRRDATTWKEAPKIALKGMLMGSADVVPGVSGGTMALITGIYTRLIDAVRSVDTTALEHLLKFRIGDFFRHVHWRFLLSMISGILLAVFFFTRIVPLPVLIFTHPEPIYGLFFGLIVGSVVLLLADVRPLDLRRWVLLAIGTAIGWWVVTLVPTKTPDSLWFIFLSGALAISAMLLPGISGSFILLILGKYSYIFGQFAALGGPETMSALTILAVFGIGILVGIALFSRFLSWLLHHYFTVSMCVLIGFLVGSLVVIWPWQDRQYERFSDTMAVEQTDLRAKHALPPGSDPHLPEFFVESDAPQQAGTVELHRVRKHLVRSQPTMPSPDAPLALPIVCMVSGIALVLGIEMLAKRTSRK